MALFEGKTKAERNKLLGALGLGLVAFILILRMFFGGDDPPRRGATNTGGNSNRRAVVQNVAGTAAGGEDPSLAMPNPLPPVIAVAYTGPDASRNIFAFPAVPVKTVAVPAATIEATPTPTPPPPLTVHSVSPANVFARTADFQLEVSGDKFTPQSRIYVDGQELPTTFKGAQQLAAKVPAALIAAQGARAIDVKTPDGQLYSNTATINVMAPPTPQVTFIGLFGTRGYSRDRAVLKPTQSNDLLTVQRGDLVSSRFKVTAISERAVELVDTQLNIKHTVPFSDARGTNIPSGPGPRVAPPPQRADDDDDEP